MTATHARPQPAGYAVEPYFDGPYREISVYRIGQPPHESRSPAGRQAAKAG